MSMFKLGSTPQLVDGCKDLRVLTQSIGRLPLRAVLTRPASRQKNLTTNLAAQGWQVLEVPALELVAVDQWALRQCEPAAYDWVMFVSRTAWQLYRDRTAGPWPASTGIAVVGQGTANVIQADLQQFSALPPVLLPDEGCTQDSEGLWQVWRQHLGPGSRVLIVAGRDGRSWMREQLREHGVKTNVLHVYERRARPLPLQEQQMLRQWTQRATAGNSGVWLLTSKQSIEALQIALADTGLLRALKPSAWLLTHPRLIEHVQRLSSCTGADYPVPVALCDPHDDAIEAAFARLAQALQLGPDLG